MTNTQLIGLKIADGIMKFVFEVAQKKSPMLTEIAVIDNTKDQIIGNRDMVSLWAAVGEANPIKRCKELKAQNAVMKELLKQCRSKLEVAQDNNMVVNISLVLDTFE